MSRGNSIIVTANPRGVMEEGYVKTGVTLYPGMVVQADFSIALIGGKHSYGVYAPGTDGEHPKDAFWIVTEQLLALRGGTQTDSYAAGEKFSMYAPLPGEEINLLLLDVAGTGDDHTAGEMLIPDTGTGKFIATTGTPECEPAVLLETVTDPTADTLAWCRWTGN